MNKTEKLKSIIDFYIKGEYDLQTISNQKFIKENLSEFSPDDIKKAEEEVFKKYSDQNINEIKQFKYIFYKANRNCAVGLAQHRLHNYTELKQINEWIDYAQFIYSDKLGKQYLHEDKNQKFRALTILKLQSENKENIKTEINDLINQNLLDDTQKIILLECAIKSEDAELITNIIQNSFKGLDNTKKIMKKCYNEFTEKCSYKGKQDILELRSKTKKFINALELDSKNSYKEQKYKMLKIFHDAKSNPNIKTNTVFGNTKHNVKIKEIIENNKAKLVTNKSENIIIKITDSIRKKLKSNDIEKQRIVYKRNFKNMPDEIKNQINEIKKTMKEESKNNIRSKINQNIANLNKFNKR